MLPAVVVMTVAVTVVPAVLVTVPLPVALVLAVERCLRVGEGHRGVRDRIRHLLQHLGAHVGRSVAGLVVAGVECLASGSAVDGCLLLGLDSLGAREEATGRNARVDEPEVVGSTVEGRRLSLQALAGEELLEQRLDLVGTLWALSAESIPVTVVDE